MQHFYITIFLSIIFGSLFCWCDSYYLVRDQDGHIGCLSSKGLNKEISFDECKSNGAEIELQAWRAKDLGPDHERLEVNKYTVFQPNSLSQDIHNYFTNAITKLKMEPGHKNGDHGYNHKDSYYGYLFFFFIDGFFINVTNVGISSYIANFATSKERLADQFIAKELIEYLGHHRRFIADNGPRSILVKLVSHTEQTNNGLGIHQDACDYLSNRVIKAEVNGGRMQIFSTRDEQSWHQKDFGQRYGQAPRFSADNSILMELLDCGTGAGYIIRERDNNKRLTFPITTHGHEAWQDMKQRDLIIVKFFGSDEFRLCT